MLDFQTKSGWMGDPSRGASMGRTSDLPEGTTATLTVRHVALTDGYDAGGAYWGTPDNLYCVSDAEGRVRYLRASDADAAKARFPRAGWAPVVSDGPSKEDITEMLDGYIECALWSSNDESDDNGGDPLDSNYSADDLTPEAREAMRNDCIVFAVALHPTITSCFDFGRCDWSLAGHDLWLTRNGHGVNFSDHWPEAQAKLLDACARHMGEVHLYVGDGDDKIHHY